MNNRWKSGVYEIYLTPVEQPDEDADLLLTVFAMPVNPDNVEDDEHAPILAQQDVFFAGTGYSPEFPPAAFNGAREIGMQGLAPERVELEYGALLGAEVLKVLLAACVAEMEGTDINGEPWCEPDLAPLPLLLRTLGVAADLEVRL